MKQFFKDMFWFLIGIILLSVVFSSARFAEGSERPRYGAGIRIVDGDTFVLSGESIRIADIDAPELFSPKCDAEKRLAKLAKARRGELLGDGTNLTLERQAKPDRFGRTLAKVLANGEPVGSKLIDEGLAAEWKGKRFGWCCS